MKLEESIIAVGALGGSGTRVVSEILIKSRVYMGDDLNGAFDNLLFTRLFKNPKWFEQASDVAIEKRLGVFYKYMKNDNLSLSEVLEIYYASKTNPYFYTHLNYYLQLPKLLFHSKRLKPLLWGWKEPNTQIYIKHIASFFPQLKYIHVLRHGLDMAFSSNKNQLQNWGFLYNLFPDNDTNFDNLARMQLDYWIESSKKSILWGNSVLKNRFYLLNYNNLCMNPSAELPKLIKFLEISIDDELMQKLIEIPLNHPSSNRYKQKDISIFSSEQLNEVKNLGFNI